jgi:hypothetical protein
VSEIADPNPAAAAAERALEDERDPVSVRAVRNALKALGDLETPAARKVLPRVGAT